MLGRWHGETREKESKRERERERERERVAWYDGGGEKERLRMVERWMGVTCWHALVLVAVGVDVCDWVWV